MTLRFWIKNDRTGKTRGPYTTLSTAMANLPEVLEVGDDYTVQEATGLTAEQKEVAKGTFTG